MGKYMTPENPTTEQVHLQLIKQSFVELVLELEVTPVAVEEVIIPL